MRHESSCSQSSAMTLSRDYLSHASLSLSRRSRDTRTGLDCLGWLVASSAVQRKMKRSLQPVGNRSIAPSCHWSKKCHSHQFRLIPFVSATVYTQTFLVMICLCFFFLGFQCCVNISRCTLRGNKRGFSYHPRVGIRTNQTHPIPC